MIKQKGFDVIFQDGKAKLRPKGSNSTRVAIEVREHGLYRLIGKPVDHEKQKQVQVPEAQREPSSRKSLQVQRENVRPKKSTWE